MRHSLAEWRHSVSITQMFWPWIVSMVFPLGIVTLSAEPTRLSSNIAVRYSPVSLCSCSIRNHRLSRPGIDPRLTTIQQGALLGRGLLHSLGSAKGYCCWSRSLLLWPTARLVQQNYADPSTSTSLGFSPWILRHFNASRGNAPQGFGRICTRGTIASHPAYFLGTRTLALRATARVRCAARL